MRRRERRGKVAQPTRRYEMPSGQTRASVPNSHGGKHHEGFDDALEKALSQCSTDIGVGNYTVTVEFEAEVNVENPGSIGFYTVKLTA
jgi:hypothetical protein